MSFNKKVWDIVKKVPKGKVTTYKAITEKLGTRAYRAVGNALNRNPHSFIAGGNVPCHRVVRSDGSVGGFAHGTRNKILMLRKEGIRIKDEKIENFKKILFRL